MKLIIEIPEELLSEIDDENYQSIISWYDTSLYYALQNGTPIDHATNGDVLISLYPNLKYTIQNGRVITTIGVASSFDLDWWNAPYQRGGKE